MEELKVNFLNLKSKKSFLSKIEVSLYNKLFNTIFLISYFKKINLIFLSLFIQFIDFNSNINYLSISPKTKSKVPITVTKSAKNNPLVIKFKPCKCEKPGALILHL